jgi:hypothetical protein
VFRLILDAHSRRELNVLEQRYQAVLAGIEDGVAVTPVAEMYQMTCAGSGR